MGPPDVEEAVEADGDHHGDPAEGVDLVPSGVLGLDEGDAEADWADSQAKEEVRGSLRGSRRPKTHLGNLASFR